MTTIELKQEREEIAKIAMMLTEENTIFYLLSAARGMLLYEAEQSTQQTAS